MAAAAMDKKVIIVTGANAGIGLEAAKGLCELGHDVVISVRDDAKGETTIAEIKKAVPNATVMYITMELSEPQTIREFVTKFLATGKKLNILLNNAGLFKTYNSSERFTARNDSSLEVTMTVNCMGPFLLTNLLLEELKANGTAENPSRIVNVSSMVTVKYKRGTNPAFFIDDLMLTEKGHYKSGFQSYRNSKLALNLWSNELAEQLKGTNVILNTVCPGFIPSTSLAREHTTTFLGSFGMKVLDSFIGRALVGTKPQAEGQKRLVRMSVGDDTKTNGIFYFDDKPGAEDKDVADPTNKSQIWELCVKYSGIVTET